MTSTHVNKLLRHAFPTAEQPQAPLWLSSCQLPLTTSTSACPLLVPDHHSTYLKLSHSTFNLPNQPLTTSKWPHALVFPSSPLSPLVAAVATISTLPAVTPRLLRSKWSVCFCRPHLNRYILTIISDDAARLSSKVRGELPGKEKELKTEAKVLGEQTGAKFDDAVSVGRMKQHH